MKITLLLLISLSKDVHVYDLCSKENLCSDGHAPHPCRINSSHFGPSKCRVTFAETEQMKNNLGELILRVHMNQSSPLMLNMSFSNIKWKKAYLRISDDANKNQNVCKMYSIDEKEVNVPLNSDFFDTCFWNTSKKWSAKTYLLEYKAENKQEAMYRKILFDMPNQTFFNDSIPVSKRLIFSYIDFTNSYKILLRIQALPKIYNVTHYKVEVFREKNKRILFLDVGLLTAFRKTIIDFEYSTYNEEGHYYFTISVISDKCLVDGCMKTITSKVYISKTGTPLVIGIVCATLIISFSLLIIRHCNRRFKSSGGFPEAIEKILILFKPSFEKHNDVVATLAKTIKHLTGIEVMLDPVNLPKTKQQKNADKWCSDNLILASHIIYVVPPHIDDNSCALDYMTYNFLKGETKKSIPEKNILILNFPYSTKDIPAVIINCRKFELMKDFQSLLKVFQPMSTDFNYENNMNCMELIKKIEMVKAEMEEAVQQQNPKIVITNPI